MLPGLHQDCPIVCALSTPCCDCRDCKFNLNQTEPQTLQANLSVQGYWALCSLKCKEQFLKNWLRLHFEVAAQRLGEPDADPRASPESVVVAASAEPARYHVSDHHSAYRRHQAFADLASIASG